METEIFCQEINFIKVPFKKIPQMQEMPNSYGLWLELDGGGGLQHGKESRVKVLGGNTHP